jgi:hypothetical protein
MGSASIGFDRTLSAVSVHMVSLNKSTSYQGEIGPGLNREANICWAKMMPNQA